MSRSVVQGLAGVALLVTACRLTNDAGVVGMPAIGAKGRLEIVTTVVAGGHATITTQVVDSVRSTIAASSCSQSVVGGPCTMMEGASTLTIGRPQLDSIFRVVTSAPFRALRSSYPRLGNDVPPDAASVRLEVTVHERTRTISWERNSSPPRILTDLTCYVSTGGATSLALCAPVS